jgi:hypothetical protein
MLMKQFGRVRRSRRKKGEEMKVKSVTQVLTLTVALFAFATVGFADGVATEVGKAGKTTGKATAKAAEKTAKGTARGSEDVAKGTEKVAKGTAHGTEKAAEKTGHGVKEAAVKTADALK